MELTEDQLTAIRKRFEESAFGRYFTSRVRADLSLRECMDMATFCRRDAEGNYVEEGLEPAWWAFQEAAELCPAFTAYCIEWLASRPAPIPPRPPYKKQSLASKMGGWPPTKRNPG